MDLEALLVDRAVMPATQHGEVRERRRAALRPVAQVMSLTEREPTAGEATTMIAMLERSPQRRWNRPRAGADFHHAPVIVVPHHHPARVARETPGRFCGNVRAVLWGAPLK
jgi:hypothetical protein